MKTLLTLILAALPAAAAFPNGYSYCKVVTTQSSMVAGPSDLTNYPLTVILTDPDLKTVANGGLVNNPSGYDIAFYPDCSGAGSALKWEVESFDPTQGSIVAHVLRPTLSRSTSDTIGMYYGGSFAAFQSTASVVWDSYYKAIWHIPGTASISDSTGLNASTNAGSTAATGRMDGAAAFTSGPFAYVADSAAIKMEYTDLMTFSFWLKTSSSALQMIVEKKDGASTYRGYQIFVSGGNVWFAIDNDNAGGKSVAVSTVATVHNGSWRHVVCTYNGNHLANGMAIYIDGAPATLTTQLDALGANTITNAQELNIGRRRSSGALSLNGTLDELRISRGIARSADWILTEYRNQNSPATYLSTGPRITPGAGVPVRHSVRSGA